MTPLEYVEWRKFVGVISRAKEAASNQGVDAGRNFVPSAKVSGTRGPMQEDYELSRFACYLVAMNGDPRKPAVAAAQAYFAVRTREAEITVPALSGKELLAAAVLEAQTVIKSQELQIEAAEKYIEELRPKAEYVETFVTDGDLRLFRNVAKSLGVTEQTLRQALLDHGWIYVEEASRWSARREEKVRQYWYSAYVDKARYFTPVPCHDEPRFRGEVDHTLKITPAGAVAVARALKTWGIAPTTELEVCA